MITDQEIQSARYRWDIISADLSMKRHGRELRALCPFHNERTPSFYIAPDKGFFHCFGCGAHGTAIDYLMRTRNLDFVEAVHEINGTSPRQPREHASPPAAGPNRDEPRRDSQSEVDAVMRGCTALQEGTAAYLYLHLRGLANFRPPSRLAREALWAHPGLYCHEIGKPLPALVAPITSSAGITAVQRIWVLPRVEFADGVGPKDSRAPLHVRKKTLGEMFDGAVRLGTPRDRLGVAEGVETAIAAALLNRGMPVWATCGASRLGSIAIPEGVTTVRIYGDNGETGHDLANRAADIYDHRGFNVEVRFPAPRHSDFNDQLQAEEALR